MCWKLGGKQHILIWPALSFLSVNFMIEAPHNIVILFCCENLDATLARTHNKVPPLYICTHYQELGLRYIYTEAA